MRYLLENEKLRVEIESLGAELRSVKALTKSEDNVLEKEYMWYADETYWGRTSPVLFPFVGSVRNKEYRYDGKTYPMMQHGFVRDMEFSVETKDEHSIWFSVESTEETIKIYPFAFRLHIGYELKENNVRVMWKVENTDTKEMYFSIGAHPGFLCPFNGETDKTGYGLHFGGLTNELHHHGNTPEGMAVLQDKVLPLEEGNVFFTPGFFDDCTYMVEGQQTGEVSIITPDKKPYVTVCFDTPLFAIWSPEGKNAPFLCIEPWYGICDEDGFEGTLQERRYENKLGIEETFEAEYSMRFE